MRKPLLMLIALAGLVAVRPAGAADGYPERTITLVAPFAAGGSSDVLARASAQRMARRLGQAIIVDNKTGAGGTLGLALVARSRPDGYTLGFGGVGSLVYSAGIYASRLPFDVQRDFIPIGLMDTTPAVIVTSSKSGIATLADLVAEAKAQPGTLTYGSAGVGGALHLAGELFQHLAGIKLVHVPYRGSAPALTDVMGGQVNLAFLDAATVMGQRGNDTIKIIAVASKQRLVQFPDVPTTTEQGFPDLIVQVWYGIVAPKSTPAPIVARLEAASQDVAGSAKFQSLLQQAGYQPFVGGQAAFEALIGQELSRWLPIIKEAGITPQ